MKLKNKSDAETPIIKDEADEESKRMARKKGLDAETADGETPRKKAAPAVQIDAPILQEEIYLVPQSNAATEKVPFPSINQLAGVRPTLSEDCVVVVEESPVKKLVMDSAQFEALVASIAKKLKEGASVPSSTGSVEVVVEETPVLVDDGDEEEEEPDDVVDCDKENHDVARVSAQLEEISVLIASHPKKGHARTLRQLEAKQKQYQKILDNLKLASQVSFTNKIIFVMLFFFFVRLTHKKLMVLSHCVKLAQAVSYKLFIIFFIYLQFKK